MLKAIHAYTVKCQMHRKCHKDVNRVECAENVTTMTYRHQ